MIFHSGTGEDRAGVGTALLLLALGVPKETIRRDFMRSNPCLEEELKYMRRLYRAYRPENIFDLIENEYGGGERFLRKKLYLTAKATEELRKKYLI